VLRLGRRDSLRRNHGRAAPHPARRHRSAARPARRVSSVRIALQPGRGDSSLLLRRHDLYAAHARPLRPRAVDPRIEDVEPGRRGRRDHLPRRVGLALSDAPILGRVPTAAFDDGRSEVKKMWGTAEEPCPTWEQWSGVPLPRTPGARRRGAPLPQTQSLKFRITVGMSRSVPKSLLAIGPKPPLPSGREKPFLKNG